MAIGSIIAGDSAQAKAIFSQMTAPSKDDKDRLSRQEDQRVVGNVLSNLLGKGKNDAMKQIAADTAKLL